MKKDKSAGTSEAISDLLDVIQGFKAAVGGEPNFMGMQRRIAEKAAAIERAAVQEVLQEFDLDAPRVTIGGERYTRTGREEGVYHTLAGDIVVNRTLYQKEGKPDEEVVDCVSLRASAMLDGWLPETANGMAFLVQAVTAREAEAIAKNLGRLPYSRSSFERVTHATGKIYMSDQDKIDHAQTVSLDLPEETRSLSISLDRVSVPMEESRKRPVGRPRKDAPKRPVARNFRMAYCATLTLHDASGEALYTIRYAGMPNCDPSALCTRLRDDARILLAKRNDLRVLLLCDGAPELWNLLRSAFSRETLGVMAYEIVDLWHLLEKLAIVAGILGGPEGARFLLMRWKKMLLNDSDAAAKIFEELLASGKQHVMVGKDRPVDQAMCYIANHYGGMDYATARSLGLPIGSGNVEATCKTLFEVRMKRSGSRWKGETGEEIIRLRALACSDRWETALPMVFSQLQKAVQIAA